MSNASDDKTKQSTDKDAEKSPLGIKSEALKKLTDSELDEVAGGLRPRGKPTLNPTSTDGCCGG